MQQNPQGQQRLVAIYVSLARDLQRQMEIADPTAKKALGVGFETFLKEVAADATELNILNWVGETYRGMGESFGTTLKTLTPEAKGYFVKAADTFQKILEKGKADTTFLPPAMATHIRIQLAKCNKYMGDYLGARDIYESILKASPSVLPAQVEAAKLYQDWGAAGKEHIENYMRAIVGARPDKAKNNQNTIWGWGEIGRKTAGNAQFKEQFYEARYNLALCRYNYALAQTEAAKKEEQLKRAKSDIALTAGLYADLGGEERKKQFDTLLRNIQKGLGERAEGLKALQSSATQPASSGQKTSTVSAAAPAKK
jgi:tetratricopeptide (TPR) repeat protein